MGLLLVVLAAVGWRFYRTPERMARDRAVDRRTLALRVLAEEMVRRVPGSSVLVVANPFRKLSGQPEGVRRFEEAALAGLKAGWRDRVRLEAVAYPDLAPEAQRDPTAIPLPPDATTPLSFMQTPSAWDDLRRAHPEARYWVSLIGLPVNVRELEVWQQAEPGFVLLLPDVRWLGGAGEVRAAFDRGKLLAMVLNRPGAPAESRTAEEDAATEFTTRFLLVTKENVDAMVERYPALF